VADENLLRWAAEAETMASFCEGFGTGLVAVDVAIDTQIGNFKQQHIGKTPSELLADYQGWNTLIVDNLSKLDTVASSCRAKAREWRAEYQRQQDREEQERKDKEKANQTNPS